MFAVGMVCFDEGMETPISVRNLEGQTVHLDIQKLMQYSFFPGQVIGIEGTNPDGRGLIASSVINNLPLPVFSDVDEPPAKKLAMDQSFHHSSSKIGDLYMVIAAGPFTTCENLLFQPLLELLNYASRMQCQLLILLGPFLDSEHCDISDRIDCKDIFDEIIMELKNYVEDMPHARVVLVPSIRDINNKPVIPQDAFAVPGPEHFDDKITYLTNPGVFEANKVKVGCCNVDILKGLEYLQISDVSEDRILCSVKHVLHQRSFYPLYPLPEDVTLNYSDFEALQFSSIPDIIILPSDLVPFIKKQSVGDGTGGDEKVCISVNPGRLAKRTEGGTFVELIYHADLCQAHGSIIRI